MTAYLIIYRIHHDYFALKDFKSLWSWQEVPENQYIPVNLLLFQKNFCQTLQITHTWFPDGSLRNTHWPKNILTKRSKRTQDYLKRLQLIQFWSLVEMVFWGLNVLWCCNLQLDLRWKQLRSGCVPATGWMVGVLGGCCVPICPVRKCKLRERRVSKSGHNPKRQILTTLTLRLSFSVICISSALSANVPVQMAN